MSILLTVDPGKMSGWGLLDLDNPLGSAKFGEFEFLDMMAAIDYWSRWAVSNEHDLMIVLERFVILKSTANKSRGDTNWSIETIGLARYVATRDEHFFDLQGATEAKAFGTDILLKQFGFWTKGSDHARDAARHSILAIAKWFPDIFDEMEKATNDDEA